MENLTETRGATLVAPFMGAAADDAVSEALQGIWMLADFFINADKCEVVLRPATMIQAGALLRGWADGIQSALQVEGV